MTKAEDAWNSGPDEPAQYDPEAALHRQNRQAGRIVRSSVLLVSGAIIYSAAMPAGLAAWGLAAALTSTLASITLAIQNLDLKTVARPNIAGLPTATWISITSASLTVTAVITEIVTIALLYFAR
ncbi:hypothetical protein [Cryobacterium sp. GrIS_2_6]|uniref:hypothetical protein n=1 Tax=Cryobacterium sp. GrIS_2_6 TaxID=3162785 RepID=UPI002DFF178C|nr:hypothetical protein [Cryobacterium psychrotolerans]